MAIKAYRLDKNHRLIHAEQYSQVFAAKNRIAKKTKLFMVFAMPCEGSARLGVSVAKKYVRSAVMRNLFKRIVKESFRLQRPELPLFDFVVMVKFAGKKKKFLRQEIWDAAQEIWQQFRSERTVTRVRKAKSITTAVAQPKLTQLEVNDNVLPQLKIGGQDQ